ncbi:MAG: hypothetical protein ACJ75R_08520 [Solirubrobacterales bacterium]
MRRALLIAAAAAMLLASGATASSGPAPGSYVGKGKHVTARVTVNDRLEGLVRYSAKTPCGTERGKLDLGRPTNGAFKGKRVYSATHRSTRVRARISVDGASLRGTVRFDVIPDRSSDDRPCHAQRSFAAKLNGGDDAFVPGRDFGHYLGRDETGLPISFDVVPDGAGGGKITNLAVDVAGDCDDGTSGASVPLVVHLQQIEGSIAPTGDVDIEIDDGDSEWDVFGTIGGGTAELEVWIDGLFDANGIPDPAGDLACVNDEPVYTAARQ